MSRLGDEISHIALLVLMYNMTGSALAVATLLLVQTVPTIAFGLVAGVLADRLDKRRVMLVSDLARCALIALMPFAVNPTQLYALALGMAIAACFFEPARAALVPAIVPAADLVAANGASSSANQLMSIFGPAIGGLFVAVVGVNGAFWADAMTFGFAAACVAMIRAGGIASGSQGLPGMRGMWTDAREGLTALIGHPVLRPVVVMVLVTLLGVSGVNVLLVPFVLEGLQAGTTGYGLLMSVFAAGLLAGGLLAMATARRIQTRKLLAASLVAIGATVAPVAGLHTLWAVGLCFFVTGVSTSLFNVVAASLAQEETPEDMRGRVFGVFGAASSVVSLVAMGLAGLMADRFGVRLVWILDGALVLLAGAYGWWSLVWRMRLKAVGKSVVEAP